MHSRLLAGWKGLILAAAVASLALLPMTGAIAAQPAKAPEAGKQALIPAEETDGSLPTLYPRANYQWPYATGPYFGEVDMVNPPAKGVLFTVAGAIDTNRGIPAIPQELRTTFKLGKQKAQYFLLQVDTASYNDGSFLRMKDSIESAGGAISQNMGPDGFIVRLTPAAYAAVQGQVRFLEPYHPAFKLDPSIGRTPLPDPAKAVSSVYSLVLRLFPGEDSGAVAQAVQAMGGTIKSVVSDQIDVDIDRSKMADIAALEPVFAVYEEGIYVPADEKATTLIQTGAWNLGATPYHDAGIDGSGNGVSGTSPQVLGITDTGISIDAGDLSDTKANAGTAGLAHRKVVHYQSTSGFGTGTGDLLACDAPANGGFTHGHIVASVALGNGSVTKAAYGGSWYAIDPNTKRPWKVDGVAPGAKLSAFDCQVSSTLTACTGPTSTALKPGTAYATGTPCTSGVGTAGGTLCYAYGNYGAKVYNWSWQSVASGDLSKYNIYAPQVDGFINDYPDAMLFVAAGNAGRDSDRDFIPDPFRSYDPATVKNGIVVGNSYTANDGGAAFPASGPITSGTGPASTASGRITPLVRAPGSDLGALGVGSMYACRSNDNDQLNPVQCDIPSGQGGSSFSSAAAAGAALLIRDYFAQGFYPTGTQQTADQVLNISGALLKSVLMLSGEFMDGYYLENAPRLNAKYRFNYEQGYGRIQLNNVLPLATYNSPPSMIVADGGIGGGKNDTTLAPASIAQGATQSYSFTVNDTAHDLRIGLSWVEAAGDLLTNDLDLKLVSPSGKTYIGNYFTDDANTAAAPYLKNRVLDIGEDCTSAMAPWCQTGVIDASRWSLPVDPAQNVSLIWDSKNPTEAIFLSPNFTPGNPLANQLETGTWTVSVIGKTVPVSQNYALAIVGAVSRGSWAGIDVHRVIGGSDTVVTGDIACNDKAQVVIDEFEDVADPTGAHTPAVISARTAVQVVDTGADRIYGTADDVVVDTESGLTFVKQGTTNVWKSGLITISANTVPDPSNGALDVRDGQYVRVVYSDIGATRTGLKLVNCRVQFEFGAAKFALYGQDASAAVNGGCERDARGYFTSIYGYPDQFMDHGELVDFQMFVRQFDSVDLTDAQASLKAVLHDLDSPQSCRPFTRDCADPNRTNNPVVDQSIMRVLDSPKSIGFVPSLFETQQYRFTAPVFAISFTIQMGNFTGLYDVDLLLGISAKKSGKAAEGLAVYRTWLNANEQATYYSTDFPTGGATEFYDWNNNEHIENPTTFLGDVNNVNDYHFETVTWSDLTKGGTRNTGIQAPWNFDTNNGGFTSGIVINSTTTLSPLPANWGEDQNYNGIVEGTEDRDPANGVLDQNWSTRGGCGWMTKSGTTGGIWHTGTIYDPDSSGTVTCMVDGATIGQCQRTEPFPAAAGGGRFWWENLQTPIVSKVNLDTDAEGRYVYRTQFTNWAWNMEMDVPDSWSRLSWELDTDVDALRPVTLNGDNTRFNSMLGPIGAIAGGNWPLFNGYPQFADYNDSVTQNGTVGGNRVAKNCCFFEQAGTAGRVLPPIFPHPVDDDLRNGWCNAPTNPNDKQTSCTAATAATDCSATKYDGTCVFDAGTTTDQFVKANGPLRNMNMTAVNGFIEGRFTTFEDTYGDDGINWQGAVGYMVNEAIPGYPPQVKGYGVAIDDMVLEWKEVRVAEDTTTTCATGACATLDIAATQSYQSLGRIDITVTDYSPGKPAGGNNDCDHNGVYTDAVDSIDCDGNGARDVYVRVTSVAEPLGEWQILNETSSGSRVFKGNLPISSAFNSPGTLYVRREGTVQPAAIIQYNDPDDGTGNPCQPNPNPSLWGFLQAQVTINVSTGRVVVKSSRITNDVGAGDGDSFADTNETVNMYITVSNKTGKAITNLVARLASNSPYVDCIIRPQIVLAALPKDAVVEIPTAFVWKVTSAVARADIFADLSATFNITLSSDQFDASESAQSITQDLDLDVTGGGAPTTFLESFEGTGGPGDFGLFTSMSLDSAYTSTDPASSTILADGTRCQYNDPDYVNSNSFGETYCYPGFSYGVIIPYDWHVHRTSNSDGGRAYVGSQSVHWGRHKVSTDPDKDTEALSALQALQTAAPVYLGYAAQPEFSFKHQIALMDFRVLNSPYLQGPDRAVVHLQLADPGTGNPQGIWQKLYPYQNIYDVQPTNNYINCTFDPNDDGNDEDSYFDPTDPNRFYGPSSTCMPEFVFSQQGDTNWRSPWIAGNTLRSSDDPVGMKGSIDRGNWVETRFNLDRYKGRAVRLRMLVSTIKVGDAPDAIAALGASFAPRPTDDGWFIDDVQVSNTLTSPATLTADTNTNSGLPVCPSTCSAMTAVLNGPASSPGPGQQILLDASSSAADRCVGGTLQFKFSSGGTTLQDWSDIGTLVDTPLVTTSYQVDVRCSTLTSCAGSATKTVTVGCPTTGTLAWTGPLSVSKTGGLGGAEPDQALTISWGATGWTDITRGDLGVLRTSGTFKGSVLACTLNDANTASTTDGSTVLPGFGFYFLGRGATCNVNPYSYDDSVPAPPSQKVGRNAQILSDVLSCP